ncbi:MAG: lipid IV(A) 3-deoxy-D-manno-octulosonic acid transferase [Gallionella sp.]|nr:lipid IV(A) 3-deoxy-D-manno-octulosonic acid transferase [Gallionella sp.]
MSSSRFFYTLALWLLLPYVIFHLLWRARKQPEYLRHIGERFGFYSARSHKPIIWLHTVSVGETRAAATLVKRLQARYPNHQILLTHTTPTGRAASEQLYGDQVMRVYLPYDYPFAVRRFLRHFRPEIGVLLETEIWFNLVHACKQSGIPLLLLNARMSEKSAKGYRRLATLTRNALGELTGIAAQTEADALRLQTLGATTPVIMGNLKFDIEPPEEMLKLGAELRQRFGTNRPVFLAASTREGEEALLLEALKKIDLPGLLTIIVPRHPQRFEEVARLIRQNNFSLQRRSENSSITAQTQVVLGDSMGEMFAYYAACDVAFIGGSLLPFGGQNLIEASTVGKPVLIGPHTYNFAQATEMAIACGAALQVNDAEALAVQLAALLNEPHRCTQMGEAGLAFARKNRGATECAIDLIGHHLVADCRT